MRPHRFTSVARAPQAALALAGLLFAACGAPADALLEEPSEFGQAHQPIVGGALDEATDGVVGLALDLGRRRVAGHCSGTLIAPNLVLTARHCIAFTEGEDEQGTVQCDSTQFDDPLPARLVLASPEPVRPTERDDPSYVRGREIRTLGAADVCGFDIALVILEGAGIPPTTQPIEPRLSLAPRAAEPFSAVGYGLTDPDDPSSDGTRQRAEGSAVRCSRADCVELSDGAIRDSEWASVNAPICSGDSGGPALDAAGRVFGVASRGDEDCAIAVYGDVSSWAPFIRDTAREAAELGGYEPPAWALGDLEEPTEAAATPAPGPAAPAPDLSPLATKSSSGGCQLSPGIARAPSTSSCLAALVVSWIGWTQRRRRRDRA